MLPSTGLDKIMYIIIAGTILIATLVSFYIYEVEEIINWQWHQDYPSSL